MHSKSALTGILALFALCVLPSACSDNPANPDNGQPGDIGVTETVKGDGTNPKPDGTPILPDYSLTSVCDKTCQSRDLLLCVTAGSECVECTSDKHCTGNPWSLGPLCDTTNNICGCGSSDDCKSSYRGSTCNTTYYACGCKTNADCTKKPFTVCTDIGAMKICDIPCRTDAECAAKDPTRGKCDTVTGQCFSCIQRSDCADSPFGTDCQKNWCHCAADTDCGGANVLGKSCISTTMLGLICGCKDDSSCANIVYGPTCDPATKLCSCYKDADCKAPYSLCMPASSGSKYLQCHKPCNADSECGVGLKCNTSTKRCTACVTDADCQDASMPHCDSARGKCAECVTSSHCPKEWPVCDPNEFRCIECTQASDCASSPKGGACTKGACGCNADGDCGGASLWGAKCITRATGKECGCSGDASCNNNVHGPRCHSWTQHCSCLTDTGCPATAPKCAATSAGDPATEYEATCQKACTASSDCAAKDGLPTCNTTTGKCVVCTKDADCTDATKVYCHGVTGKCVACKADSDCQGSKSFCGPLGKCANCRTAADCASKTFEKVCDPLFGCVDCVQDSDCGPSSLGKTCDVYYGYCQCATNADCADNLNGHVCDVAENVCSCKTNSDCPSGKTCSETYGPSTFICK